MIRNNKGGIYVLTIDVFNIDVLTFDVFTIIAFTIDVFTIDVYLIHSISLYDLPDLQDCHYYYYYRCKLFATNANLTNAQYCFFSMSDLSYKYFMTVSPKDGKLYMTDYQNLRIIRIKTMGSVRDLAANYEIIAGTGEQCIPGEAEKCGDEGLAINAKLFYPKGT